MSVGTASAGATLHDLFTYYDPGMLFSNPAYRTELLNRDIKNVPITDFLGSVLHVVLSQEFYPLEDSKALTKDYSSSNLYKFSVDDTTPIKESQTAFNNVIFHPTIEITGTFWFGWCLLIASVFLTSQLSFV